MKVFKYQLMVRDFQMVEMPSGARVLGFGNQIETPTIWALVDPTSPLEHRTFRMVGTGHETSGGRYIGTAQFADGLLVFHLFETS